MVLLVGSGFISICCFYCCCWFATSHVSSVAAFTTSSSSNSIATTPPSSFVVPPLTSSYGSYPNPLNITKNEQVALFHPVLKLPRDKSLYIVSDYSFGSSNDNDAAVINLASDDERDAVREYALPAKVLRYIQLGLLPRWNHFTLQCSTNIPWLQKSIINRDKTTTMHFLKKNKSKTTLQDTGSSSFLNYRYYGIGRYDEDRVSLYRSQLFDNTTNSIDGYTGRRTVHVGVDLNGPLGTPIYAFMDGILHSAGYNPELGDYGYVVVLQHTLVPNNTTRTVPIQFYALYGHLDERTTAQYRRRHRNASNNSNKHNDDGIIVKKGQLIGRLGDIYENGGWKIPHVHFQLSISEPETHDMPGAVAVSDRGHALWTYPDPRYVLGELY